VSAVTAFGGDPAVKAALLARIDGHLANGTLTFGGTAWDGRSGSALGVSVEGTDPADYADAYGYPLPLAALLDILAEQPVAPFDAAAFVRSWVDAVRPGADLGGVQTELMLFMLDDPRLAGIDDDIARQVRGLHRRALDGVSGAQSDLSALRAAIVALPRRPEDRRRTMALQMWESAAWPAARGHSTLIAAFTAWRQLHVLIDDPNWSDADEQRKESLLGQIWDEQHAVREAGDVVDYHAHLIARDGDLADRFVTNLRRVNGSFMGAAATLANRCIAAFRAA